MITHIVIQHNRAHVELGDINDSAPIKNNSCATPLKKIEKEFGSSVYLQIDSMIYHMMEDGRTEMIQDIKINELPEDLGIVGVYKPNSIPKNQRDLGFTPMGKYNSDKIEFGDANYFLLSELGQENYSKFESHILEAVNNGDTRGIINVGFNARIDWKLTTELEWTKQDQN